MEVFLFFFFFSFISSFYGFINMIAFFMLIILLAYSGYFFFFQTIVMDKISFFMLLLVIWFFVILVFCILSYKFNMYHWIYAFLCNILLMVLLSLCFCVSNLLMFYVFFEFSLLPLIYLVMMFGYQIERISAVFYLFFYTLVGSFPLFLVLMLYFEQHSLVWFSYFCFSQLSMVSLWMLFVILVAFFIKLPSYGLHLWLPKAHVEAPAVGSMVLAAILLKLSAYGMFRFLWLGKYMLSIFFYWVVVYLIWGAFLAALLSSMQSDSKSLIAYSSVSHMGVMLVGIFILHELSLWGVWLIVVSHAFVSSLLFYLTGSNYQSYFSRQTLLLRGQMNTKSVMALVWVLGLVANFSVPPFLGLLGELSLIWVLFSLDFLPMWVLGLTLYCVSYYCVYLLSVMVHGRSTAAYSTLKETESMYLLSLVHLLPILLYSLKSGFFH